MRKTLSTMAVAGLSLMLLGCPPADSGKDGGGDAAATDGGGDAAATDGGDAASAPADGDAAASDGGDKPAESAAVDISHVKKGQKYHFHMTPAPGTEMDMVWEVLDVTDTEIKYSMTTIMGGKAVGPATEQTWAIPAPTGGETAKADPNAKPPAEETITVAGKEWDCWVVESAGIKTWAPKKNNLPTFPSYVKQMKGDTVTNELTKIEE